MVALGGPAFLDRLWLRANLVVLSTQLDDEGSLEALERPLVGQADRLIQVMAGYAGDPHDVWITSASSSPRAESLPIR